MLTCGHIFRDSQGKGQITVDLCGPAAPQDLPGKLVRYDCTTNDIGLVSIRPGVPVRAAPIAPREYQVSKGDPVITWHLGDAYRSLARYDEALATYERALTLSPEDDDAAKIREQIESLQRQLGRVQRKSPR